MSSIEFFAPAWKIDKKELAQFEKLSEVFLAQNSKLNLSAIRDRDGVFTKHFLDSLFAARFLKSEKFDSIFDLGCGGGFPLLPLSIIFPKKNFWGIDSVQKKIAATREMSADLNLKNVEFLPHRAEILAHEKKWREKFSAGVSRAFAPLKITLEIGLPLLKIGGRFCVFRGPAENPGDRDLPEKFGGKLREVFATKLPGGEKRQIWIFEKIAPTAGKCPRRWSQIRAEK